MTPDRWKRIEQLYHSALLRPESERRTYLAQACPGDQGLLREVEELLRPHQSENSFLETPALAATATEVLLESASSTHPSRMMMPGSADSGLSLSNIPPQLLQKAVT